MSMLLRAKCPVCGRECAVQPPRGGDGSADVFPRHGNGAGGQCPNSRCVVDRSEYVGGDG